MGITSPRKILLTEGSSLSARQTLYALGKKHTIDFVDPKSICLSRFSSLTRKRLVCPRYSTDPTGYLQFLAQLIQKERYDVLLPTHEQVFLLSRFRDVFSRHVGLALPDFEVMQQLQSKVEFSRLLDELKLPQPKTTIFRTRQELESLAEPPCFIKLAHSTAGSGVYFIQDNDALHRQADKLEKIAMLNGQLESLIQQPGKGIQSTVQAVFHQGQLVGIHMFEARMVGVAGMSAARIGTHHPEVLPHVRKLGEHTNWHGAMFLDYFYEPSIGPQYIEANPRIGETVNAWRSGVNLCELLVRVSLGECPSPPPKPRLGIRTHSGFMILITKGFQGANRREILAEWWKATISKGLYQNSEDELTRFQDDIFSPIPYRGVASQLLINPNLASSIVKTTVDNYSLPEASVQVVRELPEEIADQWFN